MAAAPAHADIVKICGIRDISAARAAIDAGASHLGLVFVEASPRFIGVDEACALAAAIREMARAVRIVGLTQNADAPLLEAIVARVAPDALQFHGAETTAALAAIRRRFPALACWKALAAETPQAAAAAAQDYAGVADLVLFDAAPPVGARRAGGHGAAFDWDMLLDVGAGAPWLLAGGLTPETVAVAIERLSEADGFCGVDVSSGVESAPGQKDAGLIANFVAAAHAAMKRA